MSLRIHGMLAPLVSCCVLAACGSDEGEPSKGGLLEGSLTVENELDLDLLGQYDGVTGNLLIRLGGIEAVEFTALTTVGGDLTIEFGHGPDSLAFPQLSSLARVPSRSSLSPTARRSLGWRS